MQRTPILPDLNNFPERLHPFLTASPVYDSSCSPNARVWYLEKQNFFLKTAKKGALESEARMNRYFHALGLGPEVLDYFTEKADWLLTRAIPGEDCTDPYFRQDPKRLTETIATLLRQLHAQPIAGCPISTKTQDHYARAKLGYESGRWEPDLFANQWHFSTMEEAWNTVEANFPGLKNDTLLHGDYCLPNILLDRDWNFTGFIDLGNGGIGDRHQDLIWGIWTLEFNLHTNHYRDLFLDIYGRDQIEPELLRTAAALEIFS